MLLTRTYSIHNTIMKLVKEENDIFLYLVSTLFPSLYSLFLFLFIVTSLIFSHTLFIQWHQLQSAGSNGY